MDPGFPTLPRDPYDRPEWQGFNAYESLLRAFKSFPARDVLKLMSPQDPPVAQLEATFHCLLNVSDWQSIIEDLERNMRRLQSRATESLEKNTLEDLGAFRRKLAAALESIADDEARMLIATGMATMRSVGRQVSPPHTVISGITFSQATEIAKPLHRDKQCFTWSHTQLLTCYQLGSNWI